MDLDDWRNIHLEEPDLPSLEPTPEDILQYRTDQEDNTDQEDPIVFLKEANEKPKPINPPPSKKSLNPKIKNKPSKKSKGPYECPPKPKPINPPPSKKSLNPKIKNKPCNKSIGPYVSCIPIDNCPICNIRIKMIPNPLTFLKEANCYICNISIQEVMHLP